MIREATTDDAEAMLDIYNYYILNTVATFEQSALSKQDFIARIERVQQSALLWLVALQDDKVLGYAYSSLWNERAAYRHTVEISVYLSNSVLSKGWGTQLYEALFSGLRKKSIHSVIRGITLPNSASVAIHEKFGMKQVAQFKQVGFKFGQWLDVGYWQGRL